RPAVTMDSRKCAHCSRAAVCLPEEDRVAHEPAERGHVPRLFPEHPTGNVLHLTRHDLRLGRNGDQLVLKDGEGEVVEKIPAREVASVVVHGNAQVSTQALQLCAWSGISVFWFTRSGAISAGLHPLP